MKFLIPAIVLVAATSGGVVLQQKTKEQPPKKEFMTQDQKQAKLKQDHTQKKQVTEEQRLAYEQKKALQKQYDEKAYADKLARKKAQQADYEQKRAPQKQYDEKAYAEKLARKKAQQTDFKAQAEEKEQRQKQEIFDPTKLPQKKPAKLSTTEDAANAFQLAHKGTATYAEMTISYHEIVGLNGQYQWHIGDTHWWIRLHDGTGEAMNRLDKSKTYKVTGFVLDQHYGVIQVWYDSLASID
jgi:hypothetical protein